MIFKIFSELEDGNGWDLLEPERPDFYLVLYVYLVRRKSSTRSKKKVLKVSGLVDFQGFCGLQPNLLRAGDDLPLDCRPHKSSLNPSPW